MKCNYRKRNIVLLCDALDDNLLFIPQRTIYRWIRHGLHSNVFFKVLGRVVVDMDELDAAIKKAKQGRMGKCSSCKCGTTEVGLID